MILFSYFFIYPKEDNLVVSLPPSIPANIFDELNFYCPLAIPNLDMSCFYRSTIC